MNKQRRKELQEVSDSLSELKEKLESLMEQEQEGFDNLPESFQEGERGSAMEDCINSIQEAIDSAELVMESIEEAINR